ncbi:hypothetical protein H1R20_g9517, partial [Candolleomyces eurysporus]
MIPVCLNCEARIDISQENAARYFCCLLYCFSCTNQSLHNRSNCPGLEHRKKCNDGDPFPIVSAGRIQRAPLVFKQTSQQQDGEAVDSALAAMSTERRFLLDSINTLRRQSEDLRMSIDIQGAHLTRFVQNAASAINTLSELLPALQASQTAFRQEHKRMTLLHYQQLSCLTRKLRSGSQEELFINPQVLLAAFNDSHNTLQSMQSATQLTDQASLRTLQTRDLMLQSLDTLTSSEGASSQAAAPRDLNSLVASSVTSGPGIPVTIECFKVNRPDFFNLERVGILLSLSGLESEQSVRRPHAVVCQLDTAAKPRICGRFATGYNQYCFGV